jgi:hypothetical protein
MLLERMVVLVVGGCKSGGGGGGDVKRGLMGSPERAGFVDVDVGVVAVSVSRSGSSWVVGGERERGKQSGEGSGFVGGELSNGLSSEGIGRCRLSRRLTPVSATASTHSLPCPSSLASMRARVDAISVRRRLADAECCRVCPRPDRAETTCQNVEAF